MNASREQSNATHLIGAIIIIMHMETLSHYINFLGCAGRCVGAVHLLEDAAHNQSGAQTQVKVTNLYMRSCKVGLAQQKISQETHFE